MPFTKISAAGIGSTGTVTLENIVVTGSLNASNITGAASTATVRSDSLNVTGVSTLGVTSATNLRAQQSFCFWNYNSWCF
jgi:hypothetical protein